MDCGGEGLYGLWEGEEGVLSEKVVRSRGRAIGAVGL
jgi:hypothetical protein